MKPEVRLLGLSYLTLKWVKYRVDEGEPKRALGLFGDLMPEFRQLMVSSEAARGQAERYSRLMWTAYAVAGVAGVVLALGLVLDAVPLAVAGLAAAVVAFGLDYASYRCFRRMVESYQRDAGRAEQEGT